MESYTCLNYVVKNLRERGKAAFANGSLWPWRKKRRMYGVRQWFAVPSDLPILLKEPNVADTETNATVTDPSVKPVDLNAESNAPAADQAEPAAPVSEGAAPLTATLGEIADPKPADAAADNAGLDDTSKPAETAPAAADEAPTAEHAATENAGDTAEQPTPAVDVTPAAGDNPVATPAEETEVPEAKPTDDVNKPAADVRAESDEKASGEPAPVNDINVLPDVPAHADETKSAAEIRGESDEKASSEPEPAPAAEPIAPVPAPEDHKGDETEAPGRAVPEGVDASKPVDVDAPLDPAASTDTTPTPSADAADASPSETKPDESETKPSLGNSTDGSGAEDSTKTTEQTLPPTPRIPDEHPKPAEECHRIDPLTGLELPADQQPGAAKADDKSEPKADSKDEPLAQDGAKGYSEFDPAEFREDVEKVLGHVRKAIKHEAEAAKEAFHKIEERLANLLARLKKGN